uniref:Decapping nuclease n=1 Tax=Panagrellus redivivus TaxID=6233 RepID=A0A7E4V0L8_PANRE
MDSMSVPTCSEEEENEFPVVVRFEDVFAIHDCPDGASLVERKNVDFPILNMDMVEKKIDFKTPEKHPTVFTHETDESLDALMAFLTVQAIEDKMTFEELLGDIKFVCARRVLTYIGLIPHDDGRGEWRISVQRFRGVFFLRFEHSKTEVTKLRMSNMILKQSLIDAIGSRPMFHTEDNVVKQSYGLFSAKVPSLTSPTTHNILYSATVDGALSPDGAFYDCFTVDQHYNYRSRWIKYAIKASLIGTDKVLAGQRNPFKPSEVTEVNVVDVNEHEKYTEDTSFSMTRCYKQISAFLTAVEEAYVAEFGDANGILHIHRTPSNDTTTFTSEMIDERSDLVLVEEFLTHFLGIGVC